MSKYQSGLSNISEAVFSDHYVLKNSSKFKITDHDSEQISHHKILDEEEFEYFKVLLLRASEYHVKWSFDRISRKVSDKINTCADKLNACVHEILRDRQFTKGSKNNIDWELTKQNIEYALYNGNDIQSVIVGLPFKMPTILKCENCKADLSEVGFLLQLYEFCQVLELLIKKYIAPDWTMKAKFLIVTDGQRFKDMIGIDDAEISSYHQSINQWIKWLSLDCRIETCEYICMLSRNLNLERQLEKSKNKDKVYHEYQKKMANNIKVENLKSELAYAKKHDPDIEYNNHDGRFVSLFQSILFTMRYKCFIGLDLPERNKEALYLSCISEIIDLIKDEPVINHKIHNIDMINSMLAEAWEATVQYISEIRSDRDSTLDIIQECFPKAIRWTIHAKKGQICLTTKTILGVNLLPWHGVSMLRKSGIKIKNYTIPFKMIDLGNTFKISTCIDNIITPITYFEGDLQASDDLLESIGLLYTRRTNG